MSLFMPRMPSGKAMTASSFVSRSMAFLRVPTTEPVRTMSSFTQGTVGSQYSPMPRTTRGGSASKKQAAQIMAASSAICGVVADQEDAPLGDAVDVVRLDPEPVVVEKGGEEHGAACGGGVGGPGVVAVGVEAGREAAQQPPHRLLWVVAHARQRGRDAPR